jgi:predicted nucleic-acid-binding protein
MIALDTNVLVRFLIEDDAQQAAAARALLEAARNRETPCFVSDVVMCETVWVLSRSYRLPRDEIVAVLRRLLSARPLVFDSRPRLSAALARFEIGRGDFADYLIREDAGSRGCEAVFTFDSELLRETGFSRP